MTDHDFARVLRAAMPTYEAQMAMYAGSGRGVAFMCHVLDHMMHHDQVSPDNYVEAKKRIRNRIHPYGALATYLHPSGTNDVPIEDLRVELLAFWRRWIDELEKDDG